MYPARARPGLACLAIALVTQWCVPMRCGVKSVGFERRKWNILWVAGLLRRDAWFDKGHLESWSRVLCGWIFGVVWHGLYYPCILLVLIRVSAFAAVWLTQWSMHIAYVSPRVLASVCAVGSWEWCSNGCTILVSCLLLRGLSALQRYGSRGSWKLGLEECLD